MISIINKGYVKLFAPTARLNRLQYFKGSILLFIIFTLIVKIINRINLLVPNQSIIAIVGSMVTFILIYYSGRSFIARLQDIGLSRWYFFTVLLVYNLLINKYQALATTIMFIWGLFALLVPGNKNANQYGTPPSNREEKNIFIA
jgi:uncharacterized membrane protein YhaH (DUF805 family)